MAIEHQPVATEIMEAQLQPDVIHSNLGTKSEPTFPLPDTRVQLFEQELALFQKSAPIIRVFENINLASQDIFATKQLYDEKLTGLEAELEARRAARKSALAKRDATQSFYRNNPTARRVRIYNLLRTLYLDPIAERVLPVIRSEKNYQKILPKVGEAQTAIEDATRSFFERATLLQRSKTSHLQESQELTENWIVADRERTLMYALQNPSRAQQILARYAVQSGQDRNASLRSLQEDYKELSGQTEIKSNGMQLPKSKTSKPKGENRQSEIVTQIAKNESLPEELEPKKAYPVARIAPPLTINGPSRLAVMDSQELDSFLKDQANSIARNNQDLLSDIKDMINHLQQNPTNVAGIERLKNASVSIGKKKFVFWHLIPAKMGSGSTFRHKTSHNLRVIYAVYKDANQTVIILDGVYTHTNMMKKYGLGMRSR